MSVYSVSPDYVSCDHEFDFEQFHQIFSTAIPKCQDLGSVTLTPKSHESSPLQEEVVSEHSVVVQAQSVELFNINQLSVIIDSLIKETTNETSKKAENKLKILREELSHVMDYEHTQLLAKVKAVLYFVNGSYSKTQKVISRAIFDTKHHPVLQFLYQKSEARRRKRAFRSFEYVPFPVSIDPICSNGYSIKMNAYLKKKYISAEKHGIKTANLKSYSKQTGLPVNDIRSYFQKLRG